MLFRRIAEQAFEEGNPPGNAGMQPAWPVPADAVKSGNASERGEERLNAGRCKLKAFSRDGLATMHIGRASTAPQKKAKYKPKEPKPQPACSKRLAQNAGTREPFRR